MKLFLGLLGSLTAVSCFTATPQAGVSLSRSSVTSLQLVPDEFVDSEIASNDVSILPDLAF